MAENKPTDLVVMVPNGGWDRRLLVCRCAPTVDSFIVVTSRYVVLIDTLLNPATATALLDIARPYLREGRTALVVNTHADWDHCWGNQLFAGRNATLPAPIIGHARSVPRFGAEMAEQLRANKEAYPGRFDAVEPTAPTITFTDRLTIDGGDLTLELFLAAGHTDDHIALFIPEIATLLAGDAVEEPFPFAYTVEGLAALRATLHNLQSLRATAAFFCHALEQSRPTLISRNIAYFDTVEERCRAALASGVATADEAPALWPFAEAGTGQHGPDDLTTMYRDGHRRHIALMLQWLQRNNTTS